MHSYSYRLVSTDKETRIRDRGKKKRKKMKKRKKKILYPKRRN
jgi:hypothetical protein